MKSSPIFIYPHNFFFLSPAGKFRVAQLGGKPGVGNTGHNMRQLEKKVWKATVLWSSLKLLQ